MKLPALQLLLANLKQDTDAAMEQTIALHGITDPIHATDARLLEQYFQGKYIAFASAASRLETILNSRPLIIPAAEKESTR